MRPNSIEYEIGKHRTNGGKSRVTGDVSSVDSANLFDACISESPQGFAVEQFAFEPSGGAFNGTVSICLFYSSH